MKDYQIDLTMNEEKDQAVVYDVGPRADWYNTEIYIMKAKWSGPIRFQVNGPATAASRELVQGTFGDARAQACAISDPVVKGEFLEFCGAKGALSNVHFNAQTGYAAPQGSWQNDVDVTFASVAAC